MERKEAESYYEVRGFRLNHSKIPSYLLQFGSSSMAQQTLTNFISFPDLKFKPEGNKDDLMSYVKSVYVEFEKR